MGYAISALLAEIMTHLFGAPAAIAAIATLTFVSDAVAAVVMREAGLAAPILNVTQT